MYDLTGIQDVERALQDILFNLEQTLLYIEYEMLQNTMVKNCRDVSYPLLLDSINSGIPLSDNASSIYNAVIQNDSKVESYFIREGFKVTDTVISAALDLLPGAGELKGIEEGIVGRDFLTKEPLAWWEKALGFACLTEIKGLRNAVTVGELANDVKTATKVYGNTKQLDDIARMLKQLDTLENTVKRQDDIVRMYKDVVRQIDPKTEARILDRVAEIKGQISNNALSKSGANFAYAEVDISGISKKEFFAHSQINGTSREYPIYNEFSLQPNNIKYPAFDAPNADGRLIPRDYDSEYKIINDLASRLGAPSSSLKGKITLFTEKTPCLSCENVIISFMKDYPNIKIEIIHNNNALVIPKK